MMDAQTSRGAAEAMPPALFERFRAGDPEAAEWIVQRYHARLIGYARLFTRRRELAEEAAQETFLAVYTQRSQVRTPEGLRPWLFTTLRRTLLRELGRKAHAMEVHLDESGDPVAEPVAPAAQRHPLQESQARRVIGEALNTLDEKDRELVTLRFFGGLQIQELSEALSIPMGTVGGKLNRALEKLRLHLEKQGLHLEDLMP
jgi:RNA polymerase sigma-70 factor (ECF subfamily)